MIPLFATNLLDGHRCRSTATGMNVRDWIHVEDHNSRSTLVLETGGPGEIYNIGGGNEMTNRLTDRLLELCGRDESFIRPVEDRLGHDRRYSVDITKITALGWTLRAASTTPSRRPSSGTATTATGGSR